MKNAIKFLLQKSIGYERYLYVFSMFKIKTLAKDAKEKDFFHFMNLIPEGEGEILDLGANIGIMTYYLAKKFPTSKVFSIEPVPSNLNILKKIVNKYKLMNVKVIQIALGEFPGQVSMVLPHFHGTKMQGLSHVKHESIEMWNDGEVFDVSMDTLDNLFPSEKIKGIKLDVENFEFYVLKGGMEVIKKNKPIIYSELWENENRSNCINFLKELKYECKVVVNNKLVDFNSSVHKHQNFLFIPKANH